MLCLHRNQHSIRRNKRCHGDDAQRGHTVDQAVVIFILKRLQCLFHDFFVRHNIYKAHFHIRQTNIGGNEIYLFFMVNYHFWRLFVLDNRFHYVADCCAVFGALIAEIAAQITLRVGVHQQHLVAHSRQCCAEVYGGGRFTHAAFLVCNCNSFHVPLLYRSMLISLRAASR